MKKKLRSMFLLLLCLISLLSITACKKPTVEEVKSKMEKELYKEYGEEFVVENIGLRDANGVEFYQAKIYPKSIIGTPKEEDDYYYSTASVGVKRFYKENSVGNSYGVIKMNDEAEEFLLPKIKELFGDKVRVKADIEYKVWVKDWFSQYLVSGFEEKREEALKNPKTQRFIVGLAIYVFDKIDDEKEKEERRKQLFELLQYMRKEKLDTYLKIFLVFPDDIILAPSFRENRFKLEDSEYIKEKEETEKKLRKEIRKLSTEEYIGSINRLKKSDITVSSEDVYYKYCIADYFVLTMEYLKIDEFGRYDEAKENNTVEKHLYKTKDDIELSYWDRYVFRKENQ